MKILNLYAGIGGNRMLGGDERLEWENKETLINI